MSHNDPGEETHGDTMLQHLMQTPETENKVLGGLGLEYSIRLPRQNTMQRQEVKWPSLFKFCLGLSDRTRCPVQQESKVCQEELAGHQEFLSYCNVVISYRRGVFPHNLRRQR